MFLVHVQYLFLSSLLYYFLQYLALWVQCCLLLNVPVCTVVVKSHSLYHHFKLILAVYDN